MINLYLFNILLNKTIKSIVSSFVCHGMRAHTPANSHELGETAFKDGLSK